MGKIDKTMALLREGAEVLIPTGEVEGILKPASESSKALQMMRKLPNMSSNQSRIKVLDQMIVAGHVNGDTGLKSVSKTKWKDVYLNAEEIAVIVPVPDSVADDAEYDLWGLIQEQVPTAFGKVIDGSVFFGQDKPKNHPACLIDLAKNYGKIVTLGSGNADVFDKIFGVDGALDVVEKDGFEVNGILSSVRAKAMLRGLKDTAGNPLFMNSLQEGMRNYALDGIPMTFATNGIWDDNKALMLGGDFRELVYSIRSDISMKLFSEGVITDADGKIVYNLMQQDMKAIRFTFRYAWAVPNTMTHLQTDETKRYPLFLLEKNADSTTRKKVTFTVKDNAGTPVAIEGAYVDIAGNIKKTNSSGVAVFNLQAGDYNFKVTDGSASYAGTATVATADVAVAVTLVEGAHTGA